MNLIYICQVKFPGQIEAGNISFRKPEEDILFATWNVPNIAKPTEAEILAEAPLWERKSAVFVAFKLYVNHIGKLIDETAQSKQYDSAISCASYTNSTNQQWNQESNAFVAWRDSVFEYAISVENAVDSGADIPDFDTFKAGIPTMVWPN